MMMPAPSEPPCIVAIHTCGRIVAAAVDAPEMKALTARDVASWVRRGHRIETMETEAVRKAKWCRCFR